MLEGFIEQLKGRLEKALPGEDAQFLMAPYGRQRIQHIQPKQYHPQKSAVLILLFPVKDTLYTMLIQRPVYDGVHSGQVAFPGGKFEERDIDTKHTALRETFEEVGICSEDIEIIGKLTDIYVPPSNFLVSPFIGYINKQPDFIVDAYEVQEIIIVDLFSLNDKEMIAEKTITHRSGYKIQAPCYEIEGLTVWGATAMIISEFNVVVEEATHYTPNSSINP